MCQTDEQYVHLCLDGEPDAFRQLVIRYQGRLVSYLTGAIWHSLTLREGFDKGRAEA